MITLLYGGYLWTNHVHIIEPRLLPMTAVDRAVPFVLWTVWPYVFLAYCMFLPLFVWDLRLFRQAALAILTGYSINLLFFIFWPTMLPGRPVAEGNAWSLSLYHTLCSLDSIANCFPSGHITAPAIGFWFLARQYPRWRAALAVVFFLLSFTILTTKQHYLWDWFGGLGTAAFGIWMAARRERKYENAP